MVNNITDALKSTDPTVVGQALVSTFLEALNDRNPDAAAAIELLRKDGPSSVAAQEQALKKAPGYYDKKKLMGAYAKVGHLEDLGSLIARENFFQQYKYNKTKAAPSGPGGPEEYAYSTPKPLDQLIEDFNKPVFDVVMTAHPTNVNSMQVMQTLRAIGQTVTNIQKGTDNEATLRNQMALLAKVVILPHEEIEESGGKRIEERNMDVFNETQNVVYHLGAIYEDLPEVYAPYDRALEKKPGQYDPTRLNLRIRLGSWGSSGDKDGNKNVNANTTLRAVVYHRLELFRRYVQDVSTLPLAGPQENWHEVIRETHDDLQELFDDVMAQGDHVTPEQFQQFEDRLVALDQKFDSDKFIEDLRRSYSKDPNPDVLNMLRRVRIFGKNFARIEYRETAEEYTRVAELLIPGYADMKEDERVAKLTEILETPGEAKRLVEAHWDEMKSQSDKPYSDDDARPIAYHTIQRLNLARDVPSMITDNVLAECETTSNLLEALLLQDAVDPGRQKLRMGIVPLFESPEVMSKVGEIMEGAYQNPVYQKHLDNIREYAIVRGDTQADKPIQQIQLAHSDNTRRSGVPAARAFIDQAHDLLRDAGENAGVQTQFFQGGSQSDPFRGGVRSVSAAINQFGVYDFFKITSQGGDNLNHFNYAGSTGRFFSRALTHMSKHIDDPFVKDKSYGWVTEALTDTWPDYDQNVFQESKLGQVMGLLKDMQRGSGNASSRASARGLAFSKVESVQGAAVDPRNIRTITFSEILQHGSITPTWLGAYTIEDNLKAQMEKHQPKGFSLDASENPNHQLSAATFQKLYANAPVFRDVMDRVMYGVVASDLDKMAQYHDENLVNNVFFQERLEPEYRQAAEMAYASLTGTYPDPSLDRKELRGKVLEEMDKRNGIKKPLEAKMEYADFPMAARKQWNDEINGSQLSEDDSKTVEDTFQRIHAALDVVTHGRMPAVDDHKYGQAINKGIGVAA